MKLIEIKKDEHYIVVDDSKIEEGDKIIALDKKCYGTIFSADVVDNNIYNRMYGYFGKFEVKKVTHSTQPLEEEKELGYGNYLLNKNVIKPLSLSEVEEAIYGYSVEKMAKEYASIFYDIDHEKTYTEGFNAHKELVKDKLFTVEDMKKAFQNGVGYAQEKYYDQMAAYGDGKTIKGMNEQQFIQSLLPKTEWECYFDEQGKIVLL